MFSQIEYERLLEDFKNVQKERSSKLRKIWGTLLLLVIGLIVFFLVLFPAQFQNGETAWILPSYGGMAFVTTFIGYMVSIYYVSEKPFFEYLFPQVVEKINFHEGLFLEYEAYEKSDKEFNTNGGIFTKYASVKIRRRIDGFSSDQESFKLYDCTMTTSNGKSQQVHFDGSYLILNKQSNTKLQIRTNGSPKQKGVDFDRQKEIEDFRVFKQEGEAYSTVDQLYLRFMDQLMHNPLYKKSYLSIIPGQIHLALWYNKHPLRKQKNITYMQLNDYAKGFLEEVNLMEQLSNIEESDY